LINGSTKPLADHQTTSSRPAFPDYYVTVNSVPTVHQCAPTPSTNSALIIPDDEHAITLIPGHFPSLLLYMTLVHAYIVLIHIHFRFFI
jgi:hypothetical protein